MCAPLTRVVVLAVAVGALAACGSTAAAPQTRSSASAPTATQTMVCGDEIKGDVKQILALPAEPAAGSTFTEGLYTCTYELPMGTMRLSVQRSPSRAAAITYLTTRRATVAANEPQLGLTDHSYATTTGVVLVLKDNETLEVDTTGLPTAFGPQQQKRTDLAYEVASAVLGCWTGH